MHTKNETQTIDKEALIAQKAKLLQEYKSYEKDLEFAANDYDKGLVITTREKLAVQIKALGAQIRQLEAAEG